MSTSVIYVPVGLTSLQRDLIEILVSIHAFSLLRLMKPDDPALNEISKKQEERQVLRLPQLSDVQMMYLLAANIRAVANHPSLLVSHYMPRQLLLMEPGERLIAASHKFQVLASIVDKFSGRDRNRFTGSMKLALIAHNVKELDLIEGFLLGKLVRIKRLSGTSLFDEKHVYDSSVSSDAPSVMSSREPSEENNGYVKYVSQESQSDFNDWVFLATSTHVAHDPDLFEPYDIDMVISFDALLDSQLPVFARTRRSGGPIPIVKLLVEGSPDHCILASGKEDDENVSTEKALNYFVKNRAYSTSGGGVADLSLLVNSFLEDTLEKSPLPVLPELPDTADLYRALTTHSSLKKLEKTQFSLPPRPDQFDIKSYQAAITDLVLQRLNACESEFDAREEDVLQKRLRETERQNGFDEMRMESAKIYKSLKEGEGRQNDVSKKAEKAKSDFERHDARYKTLLERAKHLENLVNLLDCSNELETARGSLQTLKTQLNTLLDENDKLSTCNDNLRLKYQSTSTEAANESLGLTTLEETKKALEKKKSGPLTTMRVSEAHFHEKQAQKELNRCQEQSFFYQSLTKRLQTHYAITKRDSPSKSSTNSRTRRGRSTAPVYT
ncbi:LAMI_0D04258g1_1 [Lachancea mirantina]|uniref:LAMI_0D04258g1_1 n=1 Tax=Lachancea mirantina TaxID=1230905 RepID=A0A1G4JAA9_9SACH|nr:LAMI_0D04258g1_1 [Lachancea mirantina]